MDKQLLDILVCPQCKGPLRWYSERQELVCNSDLLAYPVREGIPVMLVEEAREMTAEEVDG